MKGRMWSGRGRIFVVLFLLLKSFVEQVQNRNMSKWVMKKLWRTLDWNNVANTHERNTRIQTNQVKRREMREERALFSKQSTSHLHSIRLYIAIVLYVQGVCVCWCVCERERAYCTAFATNELLLQMQQTHICILLCSLFPIPRVCSVCVCVCSLPFVLVVLYSLLFINKKYSFVFSRVLSVLSVIKAIEEWLERSVHFRFVYKPGVFVKSQFILFYAVDRVVDHCRAFATIPLALLCLIAIFRFVLFSF